MGCRRLLCRAGDACLHVDYLYEKLKSLYGSPKPPSVSVVRLRAKPGIVHQCRWRSLIVNRASCVERLVSGLLHQRESCYMTLQSLSD